MNRQLEMAALALVRQLADEWTREGLSGDRPGIAEAAYDLILRFESPTPCPDCGGKGRDWSTYTCTKCKGTGVDATEDALLRGMWGPVQYHKSKAGVEQICISLTGSLATYQPYQHAARRLCDQGLLIKGSFTASPQEWYILSERGRIARWALTGEG